MQLPVLHRIRAGFEWLPIVTGSPAAPVHRKLIIALAARHKLPAVYVNCFFVTDRALLSYGPDFIDQLWRATGHVDRVLKGEKPVELLVQAPTKYESCQGARHEGATDAARPCRR